MPSFSDFVRVLGLDSGPSLTAAALYTGQGKAPCSTTSSGQASGKWMPWKEGKHREHKHCSLHHLHLWCVESGLICAARFFFHTRHQTTKGIWIAKAVGIEPFTVVLDLEGTDGRERGQVKVLLADLQSFLHLNVPEQCSSFSSNCVFHVRNY
jgi:hypothetical protein